jgi:prephenate dehydrogenase
MLPEDLKQARVCIWGLGLMGGSLALALKEKCRSVQGIDNNPEVVEKALNRGVVSQATTHPEKILSQADIIILAVPVGTIIQIILQLPDLCPRPVIVLDLGSTKAEIVSAFQSLPTHILPVAGHPMCGKSVSGIENADPAIYKSAPFMLATLPRSGPHALMLVEQLVGAAGAFPILLDPKVHDRLVAGTSHLPYLVSAALTLVVPVESAPLIGPGFRSTSRLSQTPTSMMLDVLETNRANLLEVLAAFQTQLGVLIAAIQAGELDTLEAILGTAAEKHAQLLAIADARDG